MGLFSSLFSKDKPIRSYEDFWHWFAKHEKEFHKAVRTQSNIERDFFKIISPKLAEVKDGFYYLTGMSDDKTQLHKFKIQAPSAGQSIQTLTRKTTSRSMKGS